MTCLFHIKHDLYMGWDLYVTCDLIYMFKLYLYTTTTFGHYCNSNFLNLEKEKQALCKTRLLSSRFMHEKTVEDKMLSLNQIPFWLLLEEREGNRHLRMLI